MRPRVGLGSVTPVWVGGAACPERPGLHASCTTAPQGAGGPHWQNSGLACRGAAPRPPRELPARSGPPAPPPARLEAKWPRASHPTSQGHLVGPAGGLSPRVACPPVSLDMTSLRPSSPQARHLVRLKATEASWPLQGPRVHGPSYPGLGLGVPAAEVGSDYGPESRQPPGRTQLLGSSAPASRRPRQEPGGLQLPLTPSVTPLPPPEASPLGVQDASLPMDPPFFPLQDTLL